MDDALRDALQSEGRIAFALVFGSAARDQTTPFSDVDVAIGLRGGDRLEAGEIGALVAKLERAVGRQVDVVIVNEAPSPLAYRVFRDGRLIFEADHAARVEQQVRAILEYLDFKPVEELCSRAVLRAAANG